MAGASGFAKKLNKKGFSLADDRLVQTKSDCVQVDILIGADNYISFVSPYAPKTQAYGMWVDKTYFDEILLNGKIPGSTSSPNSGVNMGCIYNVSAVESTIPQEEIKVHTFNDLEVSSDFSICESPKLKYGQFPYNNIFDVFFHSPTKGKDFNKYIGIIYGNYETKDILAINLINGPSCN